MRVSRSRSLVVHRVSRARRAAFLALISAIVVTVMALLITPQHPQIVLAGAGALLTQTLIGLFYWTVVLRRMLAPMPRSLRRSAILLLYGLGTLALLPYPLLIMVTVINPPRGPLPASTIALGGALFLAACTIYIHLFLVKLVRSADDQRARLMRRQVNARLMRELVRSERHSRECIA